MVSTALGKRTRSSAADGGAAPVNTPRKRSRRCMKLTDGCEDKENEDPLQADDSERSAELPRRDAAQSLSRKPRSRTSAPLSSLPITPSTPRHRDALASYPSTPRQAVMSAGKLFKRLTPSSPLSPSSAPTLYQSAHQLFARGSDPGQMVGRESERNCLKSFLGRCATPNPNGCLYISGAPGTGKSAMVHSVFQEYADVEGVESIYVNCMSIQSSKDLYTTVLGKLGLEGDETEGDAATTLRNVFCSGSERKSSQVYVLTLDEIDHVLNMGLESLYRIFEWSLRQPSRLLLIGIANALNLTDRFLPRLKSQNLKPELLAFLPYNAIQVKAIITTRLKSLIPADREAYVPFIHPAAIELCSRKVSSQTGDLRKAFEVCRRALDLIEAETRSKFEDEAREKALLVTPSKKLLAGKHGRSSYQAKSRLPKTISQMINESFRALTAETAPRASIAHLNRVTTAAFNNGTTKRLKALNLQQKVALCALVAYEQQARDWVKSADVPSTPSKKQLRSPSVKMLFSTYCQLCTRDSLLHPLSSSEFREVMGSLETLGLVHPVEGKAGSFSTAQTPSKRAREDARGCRDEKRVASSVSEKDLEAVTDGIGAGILRGILAGEALDLF